VRVVFALTVMGGLCLLTLAVWPGLIENAVFGFPFVCGWLPLMGFWFLLLLVVGLHDIVARTEPTVRRRRWGLVSAAILFGTLGFLWLHIPQRLVFAFCYADLQSLTDDASTDGDKERIRRVGPYQVDVYLADRRGGVFFRTSTGPDGLGPDQMSYGFALRPNNLGSPFGNAHYRLHHLFGDWFGFAVSNDS
jgi:hypothetical protein